MHSDVRVSLACMAFFFTMRISSLIPVYPACNACRMFHGTSHVDPVTLAAGNGVDPACSKGGYFGKAAYFARNPLYCLTSYAYKRGGVYRILVCNVLVGNACNIGINVLPREACGPPAQWPPVMGAGAIAASGFDSVVGGPQEPPTAFGCSGLAYSMTHAVYQCDHSLITHIVEFS